MNYAILIVVLTLINPTVLTVQYNPRFEKRADVAGTIVTHGDVDLIIEIPVNTPVETINTWTLYEGAS